MSSNRARYGIMASRPNFSMALGMPSGPTDLLLPLVFNRFLITLILVVNVSSELVGFIFGMSRSQLKTEA